MFFTSTSWKWWISILVLVAFNLKAQHNDLPRFEMGMFHNLQDFHLNKTSNVELLLFSKIPLADDEFNLWSFTKLSNVLSPDWTQQFLAPKNLIYTSNDFNEDYFFYLFQEYKSPNLLVYIVGEKDGQIFKLPISSPFPIEISHFEVTPTAVIIGGSYKKRPVVLFYSRMNGRINLLPNILSSKGIITDLVVYENGFDVLTSSLGLHKDRIMHLNSFDDQGRVINALKINSGTKDGLRQGRIVNHKGNKFVIGTYGNRRGSISKGLFFTTVDGSSYDLKLHNFADLQNFLAHFPNKRESRIRSRIDRRKEAGKKVRIRSKFNLNDVVVQRDKLILVGESYDPDYIYKTNRFGRQIRIFDHFDFERSAAIAFNSSGEIVWDENFNLAGLQNVNLNETVNVTTNGNELLLYYNQWNNLIVNSVNLEAKEDDDPDTELMILNEDKNPESRILRINGFMHFEENIFYTYGIERVRDTTYGVMKDVFFINKVLYK